MEERSVQTDRPPMEGQQPCFDITQELEKLEKDGEQQAANSNPPASYPKTVYILVASMLCEHLCESGLKSLMALYFHMMLGLEGNMITVALHTFNFLQYFAVLIGAVLADSFFGKINMVFYSQMVYSLGIALLAVSSYIKRAFPSRVVLIVAVLCKVGGLGGILPCLVPLAADQISEAEGNRMVKTMFTFYFVSVQSCDIISVLFMPIMKEIPCFELESCYPLAFGVPALFSIVALVLFSTVKNKCTSVKPRQPIVIQGVQCIVHALRRKCRLRKEVKKAHWLDYAEDSYDAGFIEAVKSTLSVLSIPIPLYWSLYDQQSTTWTMQASRMDNEIGFLTVLPGQIQALCPTLLLVFIPLFHMFLYEFLIPLKIFTTLLRRMIVGGFLISLAFLLAFFVEYGIELSYPHVFKENDGTINIYNGLSEELFFSIGGQKANFAPHSFEKFTFDLKGATSKTVEYEFHNEKVIRGKLEVKKQQSHSFAILEQSAERLTKTCGVDDFFKYPHGEVKVRLICSDVTFCRDLRVSLAPQNWYLRSVRSTTLRDDDCSSSYFADVFPGVYEASTSRGGGGGPLNLKTGGSYALMVFSRDGRPEVSLFQTASPNTLTVLWLIPQYSVLALSAVFFTVSAYSFIYTETPALFKSFSWTACYMTLSVGNVITVVVAGAPLRPSLEFLLFAGLMLVGMGLFVFSAYMYRYNDINQSKNRIYPFH